MEYSKFEEIISKYQKRQAVIDECYKILVKPEFFDAFYELDETLMDAVFYQHYTDVGISYVLYEWLYCDNKSPLIVKTDGKEHKYVLETIKDVYDVMEKYYKKSLEDTTHTNPTYTTSPSDEAIQDFAESINEFFGSEIFGNKDK